MYGKAIVWISVIEEFPNSIMSIINTDLGTWSTGFYISFLNRKRKEKKNLSLSNPRKCDKKRENG